MKPVKQGEKSCIVNHKRSIHNSTIQFINTADKLALLSKHQLVYPKYFEGELFGGSISVKILSLKYLDLHII